MVTLTACALLAWFGARAHFFIDSLLVCILYWGLFLALMGATFLVVWLDVRYIRLQYALERRKAFRETLGDEDFRASLLNSKHPTNDHQE